MGIANVENTFKNLPNIGSDGTLTGPNPKPLNYNIIELKFKANALADSVNPIVKIKAGDFNKVYTVNKNNINPTDKSFNNLVRGSRSNLTNADLKNLYDLEGSVTPGIKFLFNPANASTIAEDMWTTPKDTTFDVPEWQGPSIIAIIPIKPDATNLPNITTELEIEVGTFEGTPTETLPPTPTPGTNGGVSVGKDFVSIEDGVFIPREFVIGGTKVITTTTTCTNGEGAITTHVSEKRVPVAGECAYATPTTVV